MTNRNDDLVESMRPVRIRHAPLAFPKLLVNPDSVANVVTHTFVPFRGEFLAVSRTCSEYFEILDLKIGNICHHPGSNGIPAEFFEVDSIAKLEETVFQQFSRWDMNTAGPENTIQLTVKNLSDKPKLFRAALFGIIIAY